ncbi:hypothetical protein [Halobacillus sp. BBL2006]|uniref:hypothetical protein n=1 Tax=Halobacillus sp. BBL2006 TaxID=1543706 RepID=UPI0005430FDF|nr:hypothetical protein [Halobacillus sp. BBL2006]KHE68659.1 hypothetical protein LD39_14200 [Halobacillus sp. BBL2006]
MNQWLKEKKERRSGVREEAYVYVDAILDLLIWLPELVYLPFRILFWLLRGVGKVVNDVFDFV